MNIVVIRVFSIKRFPPAISLVSALLDLGHRVTLIANDVDALPRPMLDRDGLKMVELGKRGSCIQNASHYCTDRRLIRDFLRRHRNEIDLVWTTTDISARTAGNELLNHRYVLQLSELTEYVPLISSNIPFLRDRNVKQLAKRASRVVVPEYNRAFIQQAYWDLPELPMVLPNKPYPDTVVGDEKLPCGVIEKLEADGRKKLFYQGVYTSDRSLTSYAKAVNFLGDDYALYIMGKALGPNDDWYKDLSKITNRVVDLGFVPAPSHLAATHYGYIGLLPYVGKRYSYYSVLNALYCAPNKIWEYSRFGLPMIGSDVPGLASAFRDGDMGFAVDGRPEAIIEAVRAIDADYERFSKHSRTYYDSVDVKQIVSNIIDEAMR